jgi:biotin-(acetyl-CoA carboxylase) ligase
VKQNLTLTLDSELLRSARKLALDRETSVNQLVREYLAQLVEQSEEPHKKAAAEFRKAARASTARIGDATWTRDEIYDRKPGR